MSKTRRILTALSAAAAFLMIMLGTLAMGNGPVYIEPGEMARQIYDSLDGGLIDKAAFGPGDLREVSSLTVKNTYVRESVLRKYGRTLESYYSHIRELGYMDGYLLTAESELPLFDPGAAFDCLVGKIDIDGSGSVYDCVFAENNYDGRILDGEYLDRSSGVVYIRKSDIYRIEDDCILTDYVQVQLLRGSREEETQIEVVIALDCDTAFSHSEELASPYIFIPRSELPADMSALCDGRARICLNGSGVPLGSQDYRMDEEGLWIEIGACAVSDIRIEYAPEDDGPFAALRRLLSPKEAFGLTTGQGAVTSAFGQWQGIANVGDYVDFTARGLNTGSGAGRDYIQSVAGSAPGQSDFYDALITHDGQAGEDYVTGTYDGGRKLVYRSDYNADYGIDMSTCSVTGYNNEYMKDFITAITSVVQMSCIEVSKAVYRDFGSDPNLNFSAVITAVGSDYVAVSFCSAEKTSKGSSNQVLCGTYAISYAPRAVSVSYDTNGGFWPTTSHVGSQETILGNSILVQTLSRNDEPARGGYAFTGWGTSPGGAAKYHGGEKIETVSWSESGRTLYAIWQKASDRRELWVEYGSGDIFTASDPADMTQGSVPLPRYHRRSFTGYYVQNGTDAQGRPIAGVRLTDQSGNIICGDIPGVIQDGKFVNDAMITLIAGFD